MTGRSCFSDTTDIYNRNDEGNKCFASNEKACHFPFKVKGQVNIKDEKDHFI